MSKSRPFSLSNYVSRNLHLGCRDCRSGLEQVTKINQTFKLTFCLKALPGRFEEQIIKRTIAPLGKYPSQVSVQHVTNGHECGGSILNEKWVLTSASCLQ
jgi:hypothetical protein